VQNAYKLVEKKIDIELVRKTKAMVLATRILLLLLALHSTIVVRPIDTKAIRDVELTRELSVRRGDNGSKGLDKDSAHIEPSAPSAPSNSHQASLSQAPTYGCGVWEPIGDGIPGEDYYDQSGYSLDMSSDGTIVAIGAPGSNGRDEDLMSSGHARIFSFNELSLTWEQLGQDISGEGDKDNFGRSIALSSDGSILAVGADYNDGNNGPDSGHVQLYSYNKASTVWEKLGNDIDGEVSNDLSGFSLALSANGLVVAIGAVGNSIYQGHVRVHSWNEVSRLWEQLGNDLDGEESGDDSGYSVSLSGDGHVLAIAAPDNNNGCRDDDDCYAGHIRFFSFDEKASTWNKLRDDIEGGVYNDRIGESVTLSLDGSIVAIGYTGGVRVYAYDESWTQRGNDIEGDDVGRTGSSVSMSSDGDTVSIGAYPDPVRVYNFDQYLDTWTQIGDDVTDADSYSYSYDYQGNDYRRVALSSDGSTVAFGNVNRDDRKGMVQVKKIDRCVPSMSPSVSSPPSVQCPYGERDFKLEVQTDSKGAEVQWVVKSRNRSMRFKKNIIREVNLKNYDLSTTQMCLKRRFCYRFMISDSGKDGICCSHGVGYYKIFWRGKVMRKSYFEDKAKEYYKWGRCGK